MTRVMGVLNVTPDSFSDGGRHGSIEAQISYGRHLASLGADIVDVGGESTRPGATPVTAEEEQQRVLPVVQALAESGLTVSIDTLRGETARAALGAGATVVNDVSGGMADPNVVRAAAEHGATFIIGHWRGIPDPSHRKSDYDDVLEEVKASLAAQAEFALKTGVSETNIVLDPGIGFDKNAEQSWQLLAGHDTLRSLGFPIMYGVSRKRILGSLLETVPGAATDPESRDLATAVVSAFVARDGAWAVRVHDVHSTVQALAVEAALKGGTRGSLLG